MKMIEISIIVGFRITNVEASASIIRDIVTTLVAKTLLIILKLSTDPPAPVRRLLAEHA